jgi:hypothetical protein
VNRARLVSLCRIAALAIIITGCGTTAARTRRAGGGISAVTENVYQYGGTPLASLRLPGKTVFMVAAIRCGMETTDCYELGEAMDEPTRYSHALRNRGMRIVGTGPRINHRGRGERGLLDMQGRHECVGPYPYTVVYGILRAQQDTVTALGGGRSVRFRKTTIPARFHPHGVLVYAQLDAGADEITVRAPNGGIVSRENGTLVQHGSSSCGG